MSGHGTIALVPLLITLIDFGNSSVLTQLTLQQNGSSTVAASERYFARNLYQRLSLASGGDNLVVSPFSVYLLLAVLTEGATGSAHTQLMEVLGLNHEHLRIQNVREYVHRMLENKGSSIQVVARIFVDSRFPLNKDFLALTKDHYHVEVVTIDMKNKVLAARAINSYAMENSNHTIRNVITEGDLSEDSSMICVGTIHVKDSWALPFPKRGTSKQIFNISPGKSISTEMMHTRNSLHFLWDGTLKAKILLLDLGSKGLKMALFLPDQDLYDLEATLRALDIISLLKEVHSSHPMVVDVQIPAFRLQGDFHLETTFEQMGLNGLFAPDSELPGISCCGGLSLTTIRQKTYIVVEENGIEASTATAAVTNNGGNDRQVQEFYANRPFGFYLLMDDVVLFQGRVINPSI